MAALKAVLQKVKTIFGRKKEAHPETPPVTEAAKASIPDLPDFEEISVQMAYHEVIPAQKNNIPPCAPLPETPELKGRALLAEIKKAGDCDVKRALELIDAGASLETADKERRTALMLAIVHGHESLSLAIINKDVRLDVVDTYSNTALILAAEHGQEKTALKLIEKGAALDNKNCWSGKTALMYTAEMGYPVIAAALLEKGANPDLTTNNLRDALSFAGKHPAVAELIREGQKKHALAEQQRRQTEERRSLAETVEKLSAELREVKEAYAKLTVEFNSLSEKRQTPVPDAPKPETSKAPPKNNP